MPEHTPAPTPARSLYGFFLFLFTKTIMGIYCIWAFVPDKYLHFFNIYYYPQKYWAAAVPIQCLIALTLFAFLVYPSLNLMLCLNIDNINNISDVHSLNKNKNINNKSKEIKTCICVNKSKCHSFKKSIPVADSTVPQLQDLHISYVCKKLYLNK